MVRSWRGRWGAGGSGRLRVCGPDGTEQASHLRVTARLPRSKTSSSVTSLLLAPGGSVGMGGGEARSSEAGPWIL